MSDEATMRVKFLRSRDFTPSSAPHLTLAIREGVTHTIKRSWAEELIAAGDAKEAAPAKRKGSGADQAPPPAPASDAIGASAGAAIATEPQG